MMLLLVADAFAEDKSWSCPDADAAPVDVRPWYHADTDAGSDTWQLAESYYDDACVTWVDYGNGSATDCVTDTGAVLTYSMTSLDYHYSYEEEESYTIIPSPDEGLTWSELTIVRSATSNSVGGGETYEASWVGVLDAAWPEDGSFRSTDADYYLMSFGNYSSHGWSDDSCTWEWEEQEDWWYDEVVADGREIRVTWLSGPPYCDLIWEPYATIDGEFYGIVDEDDWSLILGTDADGDAWDEDHDCDDGDASIHPCAEDIPFDGIDQDCVDGASNDGDGDGQNAASYGGPDCDDADRTIYDGARDTECDGIDQDCDGLDDCDGDDDGYIDAAYGGDDCDDVREYTHPGALEVECNRRDEDCDGIDPCDDDNDGYTAQSEPWNGDDCDDADGTVNPEAAEVACDGIDQDCDGADTCLDSGDTATIEEDSGEPAEEPEGCRGGGRGACSGGSALLLLPVLAGLARRRTHGRS